MRGRRSTKLTPMMTASTPMAASVAQDAVGRGTGFFWFLSSSVGTLVDRPTALGRPRSMREGRNQKPLHQRRQTRPDHGHNRHQVRVGPTPAHAGVQPFAVDRVADTKREARRIDAGNACRSATSCVRTEPAPPGEKALRSWHRQPCSAQPRRPAACVCRWSRACRAAAAASPRQGWRQSTHRDSGAKPEATPPGALAPCSW